MIFDKRIFLFLICLKSLCLAENYNDYVTEIQRSFAKQMEREYDLQWKGSMGSMHELIEEMGMSFSAYRRATLEEARALEVEVIEKFVRAINAHEKIQPYLALHPFSTKRVMISINFEGINGRNADGSVSYVLSLSELSQGSKNQIIYCAYNPFKDEFIDLVKEPFEEALKLFSKEGLKNHHPNPYEEEVDGLLASFTEEIQKEYDLERWSMGGRLTNGIEEIGGKFKLYQAVSQEEARELIVEISDKLLKRINSNEKIRPYLKEYPFKSTDLKLRVCFEQNLSTPPPQVNMEMVALEEDKITYTQEIIHPEEEGKFFSSSESVILSTESYREAIKKVEGSSKKFKPKSLSRLAYTKKWILKFFSQVYTLLLLNN
jgi:hypothetical protein